MGLTTRLADVSRGRKAYVTEVQRGLGVLLGKTPRRELGAVGLSRDEPSDYVVQRAPRFGSFATRFESILQRAELRGSLSGESEQSAHFVRGSNRG